jgi:hypothetical protein
MSIVSSVGASRRRAALLATTAIVAAAVATPALALDRPYGVPEAQSGTTTLTGITSGTSTEAPAGVPEPYSAASAIPAVTPEPEILIANPGTPTTARDPVNITGIAQMVVDSGGGFIGLCTGTLINPRTVIFAAHCVNSRAATDYGANSGGTGIGFGFESNTRANAPGQTDELVRWLLGSGATQAGRFQTNTAQAFFNVNQVIYNPESLEPAAASFLYSDIALATLDTPAAGIPTWALLFSPLPNPGTIGAAGTGYNVAIVGYGGNGTGTSGNLGIDYRRRTAENIIGAYTDLQTFESFLFGGAPNGLTQNLYFLDFDDPLRGTAGASPFDFNAFRDNARVTNGTPTEGTTAGGDSGGPLIIQNLSRLVVAGTLSGGYTRFFNGQPANGYGTVSFYQPLNLFWDYIVANNPYHYVSAVAGNGNWEDPTRWVTTLDPNYYVFSSGTTLVNGIPTSPGAGKNGTTGDFGQICFQQGGVSDCLDTASNVETIETRPIGTATNDAATARVSGAFDGVTLEAQDQGGQALPAATFANGLPGATNFVPNNSDPVRTTGALGRYFDVTLTATGVTTLSSTVTVDRLTLGTAGAQLNIATTGSLTSLINVNHFAGINTVNGTLTSVGDYSLMGGTLAGTGRVNAPFLTSLTGTIIPGAVSAPLGTLTLGGNAILSSGSALIIGIAGTTSSLFNVVANGTSTGAANLGGLLRLQPASIAGLRAGTTYTVLTAAGGLTGNFATVNVNTGSAVSNSFSAILTPQLNYTANSVFVNIVAGRYIDVVGSSAVQRAYAGLLDQSRGVSGLSALYDALDTQSAATIQATLDALAPRTETLRTSIATTAVDNISRVISERLDNLEPGKLGGELAYIGQPVQTAQAATLAIPGQPLMATDDGGSEARVQPGALPDTMSGFVAGGYLTGDGAPMPTAVPLGGRNNFNGWYLAGGIEAEVSDHAAIGAAVSYTSIDGTTGTGGQTVRGELAQGTLYFKAGLGGVNLDARFSAGVLSTKSLRSATIVGTTYTLEGKDSSLVIDSEVGLSKLWGGKIQFGPRIAVRASQIGYSRLLETGGPAALAIDRNTFDSLQGRAGLIVKSTGRIRPYVSAYYVHDFNNTPAAFGANFAGGAGPNAAFALAGQDQDWFEVSGGLALDTGRVVLSVGADTTIARNDVSNQSYRGSIKLRF